MQWHSNSDSCRIGSKARRTAVDSGLFIVLHKQQSSACFGMAIHGMRRGISSAVLFLMFYCASGKAAALYTSMECKPVQAESPDTSLHVTSNIPRHCNNQQLVCDKYKKGTFRG